MILNDWAPGRGLYAHLHLTVHVRVQDKARAQRQVPDHSLQAARRPMLHSGK